MKQLSLNLTAALLLLTATAATAQTTTDECEKLKIDNAKLRFENANLRKGIVRSSPTTAPVQTTGRSAGIAPATSRQSTQRQTARKIDFAFVKCEGNAKAQTVTVTLLLTNAAANQDIQFINVVAIDDQGEEYKTYNIHIGSQESRNTLPTGVPVKTTFVIPKVLPTVRLFKSLACPLYTADASPGQTNIEFRDLSISWK